MSWIHTYKGNKFWPFSPRPEDIDIEEIAHALALTCRFNGHCKCFYSVAEHSVRMAGFARSPVAALLHDAAEAYVSDLVTPIKRRVQGYKGIEETILAAIAVKYGLKPFFWKQAAVEEADLTMLATEARDLLVGSQDEWMPLPEPLPFKIIPWSWEKAEREFLGAARVYQLPGVSSGRNRI